MPQPWVGDLVDEAQVVRGRSGCFEHMTRMPAADPRCVCGAAIPTLSIQGVGGVRPRGLSVIGAIIGG